MSDNSLTNVQLLDALLGAMNDDDDTFVRLHDAVLTRMSTPTPGTATPDPSARAGAVAAGDPERPFWKDGRRTPDNGCCSAVEPCAHQRKSPNTLCEACTKASTLGEDDHRSVVLYRELKALRARLAAPFPVTATPAAEGLVDAAEVIAKMAGGHQTGTAVEGLLRGARRLRELALSGQQPTPPTPAQGADLTAAAPKIEFHQQDFIPGFAAFLPNATTPQPNSTAFCVLNVGSFLAAIETGDADKAELPYAIAESMMHEVMHVLEQWAGVEFSEDRIEAMLDQYRAALSEAPAQDGGEAGR